MLGYLLGVFIVAIIISEVCERQYFVQSNVLLYIVCSYVRNVSSFRAKLTLHSYFDYTKGLYVLV